MICDTAPVGNYLLLFPTCSMRQRLCSRSDESKRTKRNIKIPGIIRVFFSRVVFRGSKTVVGLAKPNGYGVFWTRKTSLLLAVVPAFNRFGDHLLGVFNVAPALHDSRARLLEVFVVVKVVFDLLLPAVAKVIK